MFCLVQTGLRVMQLMTRRKHVDSELHLEHVGAGRSCEEGQAVSGDDLLLPAGPLFSFLVQSNTTGAAFDCRSVLAVGDPRS